ncbi:hypothetical protein F0U44_11185 [Nocardioides humilatus]|uniref:Glycosyl hydrolase family protein n=1 Tax=Nocardioides humilatus TaxID=2607660 RepID=A0A5B1LH86_9ACTN|nr:hypothetical protein [Nocardioides humilatus]KAA1419019.1 hypothetical protein F0U44_11185 [Nocardioides humilatus]
MGQRRRGLTGTTGLMARIALVAVALGIAPAALAPGIAEAPASASRAAGGDTAAQRYEWGRMMWDFAWEFGESLDSPPYRGQDITSGRWVERTTGTGRAVKYGGGVEFHSALVRKGTDDPDFGTSTLTLEDQPAKRGRWEIKERSYRYEQSKRDYGFLLQLVPADPADDDCGAHDLTIARLSPGDDRVSVGVNAGTSTWGRTLSGYRQHGTHYAFAVEVTARRITWFINGRAVASTDAAAALPSVPMTVRMTLLGHGTAEMNKSVVKIDWVRHYDLKRGLRPPDGATLEKRALDPSC